MYDVQATVGPVHILKPPFGSDLLKELNDFVHAQGINLAWFTGLGAVSHATIRYYDQPSQSWVDLERDQRLEVAGMVGNVSLLERRAHRARAHHLRGRARAAASAGIWAPTPWCSTWRSCSPPCRRASPWSARWTRRRGSPSGIEPPGETLTTAPETAGAEHRVRLLQFVVREPHGFAARDPRWRRRSSPRAPCRSCPYAACSHCGGFSHPGDPALDHPDHGRPGAIGRRSGHPGDRPRRPQRPAAPGTRTAATRSSAGGGSGRSDALTMTGLRQERVLAPVRIDVADDLPLYSLPLQCGRKDHQASYRLVMHVSMSSLPPLLSKNCRGPGRPRIETV